MEDSEKPRVPSSDGAAAKSTSLTPEQKAALAEALVKMAMDPGVQEMFRNVGRGIQSLIEAIRPYASFVGKMLYGLGEIMARLPVQLQTAVLALAARGWFYDHEADLSDYWKAEEMIRTGDVAAADVLMARHFESRLDAIESDLCVRLPHRASKIRNAVAAHRRQEFDLSIPALLAQADGVCKELRGGHFFLMDRTTRRPEADPYARANSNTVFNQVLHMALVEQIPLKQQMRKRSGAEARLLNRHAVMHGESLDFDTKENSLRALSLLNYVALALDDPDTEAPTRLMNTVVRSASFAVPAKKPLS